jgi:hypothetical protein
MYPDEYVSTKDKFPSAPHWAILKFSTTNVAGDERSRTNPGHGYPAHSVDNVSYEAYYTEQKFLAAVAKLESDSYARGRYSVLKVEPLTIKATITVTAE